MSTLRITPVLILFASLAGCASPAVRTVDASPGTVSTSTRNAVDLGPYLEVLSQMAPGDTSRQQSALAAALAEFQQSPSAVNRLRYALAIGTAGSAASNPVEARSLLTELLAAPAGLGPEERIFAESFLREFDARVSLYAQLARQQQEADAALDALVESSGSRADALSAENARLRRALDEANRKLEAVAEMERQLLEQGTESATEPPQP